MYEGPATLIFSTNYIGQAPQSEHNDGITIKMDRLVKGVVQVELWESIAAPEDANYVRVETSNGLALEGSIQQIDRMGERRWFSFVVE